MAPLPLMVAIPDPGPAVAEVQARAEQSLAWQELVTTEGHGWRARFHDATGLPWRALGPPIPLGDGDPVSAARRFLDRHPALAGVPSDQLVAGAHGCDDGVCRVRFDQVTRDGSPVRGAGVELRIVDGALVLLGVETWPAAEERWRGRVAADAARRAAGLGDAAVRPVVLPRPGGGDPAWEVDAASGAIAWVDAVSGAVVSRRSPLEELDGELLLQHHDRTPDGGETTSPFGGATVTTESGTTTTDAAGVYAVAGTAGTVAFAGPDLAIEHVDGPMVSLDLAGGEEVIGEPRPDVDVWAWVAIARAWGAAHASDITPELTVRLGGEPFCQPVIDTTARVLWMRGAGPAEDPLCVDPALIADVTIHEWGHLFHRTAAVTGVYDQDITEGVADTITALITGDPVIGPGFWSNGDPTRYIDTDRRYPEDVSEVDNHVTGLIFSGAMWDLVQALAATEGDEGARDLVSDVLAGALRGGPTLTTAWAELLLADDDDGDLANGTPHDCAILAAMDAHGIGPSSGGDRVAVLHEPVDGAAPGSTVSIEARVTALAPDCVETAITGGTLHFDVGAGWQTAPVTLGGDALSGSFTAPDAGWVGYWLAIDLDDGSTVRVPALGEVLPLSFVVGGTASGCHDFEADDGGFAGDGGWEWGTPLGRGGDPAGAASGARVWGTDLGGSDDGMYEADADATLVSSPFSASGDGEGWLVLRRWLSIEDGVFDQARVEVDGEEVWSNPRSSVQDARYAVADRVWAPQAIGLGPVSAGDEVVVAFGLTADGQDQRGGWNVDDVCLVVTPVAEDPPDPERRCGCASGPVPWLWWLVPAWLIRRRARRSPRPAPGPRRP